MKLHAMKLNAMKLRNHADIQLLLADYRDLRGEERRAVDSHLEGCPACAARLAEYQAMDVELQGLRDARPTTALRAGYQAAIQDTARTASDRRAHPELGSGARPVRAAYALASAAALLLIVAAVWTLLRPTDIRNVGRGRSIGAIPTARSAEVGSFIWQTDGVYGYEMLRPTNWGMSEPGGGLRVYSWPTTNTNGSTLGLQVTNLRTRQNDGDLREMLARFDAAPNLAEWSKSIMELWSKNGSPFVQVAEVQDAAIYQAYDGSSQPQSAFVALIVKEDQPLAMALYAPGQDASLDALKRTGIWDDFLTMIASIRPIPVDANNVHPAAPTANPPMPARTPLPTAQPVAAPTAAATLDPRLVLLPGWQLIEQELSRAVLGSQVANRVCEWIVLGRDGSSIYVWAFCAAYRQAPDYAAASLPVVIRVADDGTSITLHAPGDGTLFAEHVKTLFPPAVQQMIFDRTFDAQLPELEQHAKLRLKWPMLPPLGSDKIEGPESGAPMIQATVSIFSGRPDPTWMLSVGEVGQLDALVRGLTKGQCPPLPDQLGYRGVQVQLGEGDAGRLIAANGFVQSGDAGTAADAICLSDPEHTVERFLLSSALANVSEDLKPLLAELLQPVPTPLVTPTPAPTLAPGWMVYGDEGLGIQFTHPERWEVGTKTNGSRVFQTKATAPSENPVEPPPFWFTVLPPGFKNEDASAYNFWGENLVAKAWDTPAGETFVSDHAPEGFNTYTRLPDMTVDGFPAAVVNNSTVWEMPKDTQERRVLVKVGGVTVMFGTYYKTEEDLRTFEQVLASVRFGSLMTTRGAAALTPTPITP